LSRLITTPICLFVLHILIAGQSLAQQHLNKKVTYVASQQKLGDVLNQISKAGNFYFSYNGALLKPDSLVNLNARNLPVRDVLENIFRGKVDYKENGEFIILRYAILHFTIEPENIVSEKKQYVISGHITDAATGKRIKDVSVYEKRLLQSALTDEDGYFRLRFKGEHQQVILTASKEPYRDTSLVFLSDIKVRPEGYEGEYGQGSMMISNVIEASGLGRFFSSSAQRIQSINISGFFANSPFQASLIPGLSSHGMMSSQVVNKASLNVLGGYTAGVEGVEVAGLFNLNKGNVTPVQVAGLFNAVGGTVTGFQVAGLLNTVYQKVDGFQMAGLANIDLQDFHGTQLSGGFNIVKKTTDGVQIGGLTNLALGTLRGVQISPLLNYAKNMKGVQIGLVNLADSSSGYSIGLLNFVKHGYHKVSLSANELMSANISLKTGNANLYTMFIGGRNYSDTAKIESFGLGFGHDFIFNKTFSVAAEVSSQHLHLGNWDYANILNKGQLNLQIRLFKGFSIYGGPVYNLYVSKAPAGSSATGYKQEIVPDRHTSYGPGARSWLGWNAGVTLF
jgi:hypothetical protein